MTPVYLFVCMYVCVCVCYSSKTKPTERKCLKFSGMLGHEQGTNRLNFGSARVKGKGQGHKKANVPFANVCSLPSARSSLF